MHLVGAEHVPGDLRQQGGAAGDHGESSADFAFERHARRRRGVGVALFVFQLRAGEHESDFLKSRRRRLI